MKAECHACDRVDCAGERCSGAEQGVTSWIHERFLAPQTSVESALDGQASTTGGGARGGAARRRRPARAGAIERGAEHHRHRARDDQRQHALHWARRGFSSPSPTIPKGCRSIRLRPRCASRILGMRSATRSASTSPSPPFYRRTTSTTPPKDAGASSGSLFGSFAVLFNYRHAGFGISAEAQQNVVSQQAQGFSTKATANFGLVQPVAAYGYFDGAAAARRRGCASWVQLRHQQRCGAHDRRRRLHGGHHRQAEGAAVSRRRHDRAAEQLQAPGRARHGADGREHPLDGCDRLRLPVRHAAPQPPVRHCHRARAPQPPALRADARRHQKAAQELFDEYQKDQTRYLLVSTELALIEGGGNVALGTDVAVRHPFVSPRLGLESEVVPRYLRLRAAATSS